jgi:sugar diacid utilization regulator
MAADLAALDAITEAVESGAGLPAVVRAAAAALDVSLACLDRTGTVLAVAALSPSDERAVLEEGERLDLRVADEAVGTLRLRERGRAAVDVERLAAALGLDLTEGGAVLVARAHAHVAVEDGWRARVLGVVERGARGASPGALAALADPAERSGVEVVVLLPGADDARAARAVEAVHRELQAALPGHTFALGRSRSAEEAAELQRGAAEALLAANVAEGDAEHPVLAFDETGAYRLLLSAMSEDPAELQRFYAETVEPLVAYDEQYETDLVSTVEAYLECDGNVAATAQRMYTHRHTIRYRLERVRELSGHDVGSSDGREKLSLGLKAMRVLGIAHRGGPAREPRAR